MIFKTIFWIIVVLVIYTYIGYTFLLWICSIVKKLFRKSLNNPVNAEFYPEITIVIAAYNEEEYIHEKIANTQNLNYSKDKIKQVWVNDGSSDKTSDILKQYSDILLINNEHRSGKSASLNVAMNNVSTPFTLFSDANAMLHPDAIIEVLKPFNDSKVGCVAGQKKILWKTDDNSASKGEGIYWQYESYIKQLESSIGSTLSATGELYAIKTELFHPIAGDTILDDFEISANIALNGYRVKFAGKAIATESGSTNIAEEAKRKVRIAAGDFQSLKRNIQLINPFKNFELAFKFISHKLLRWIIVPPALLLLPLLNLIILLKNFSNPIYLTTFFLLIGFYLLCLIGYLLRNRKNAPSPLIFPYYLFMMNMSIIKGFARFLQNRQNTLWVKAKRKTNF